MAGKLQIRQYRPSDKTQWDTCVRNSKNGTFLFLRDYMDYHSDRFIDRSLVACDSSGRIVAALPANLVSGTLHSHQGLTYGGWVLPRRHFSAISMLELWDRSLEFMRRSDIGQLIYKPVPHIYHILPAEEDLYTLFRSGAALKSRQLSLAIDLTRPLHHSNTTIRKLKMAQSATIGTDNRLETFWAILEHLLREKHNTTPTHSLREIITLKKLFPDNIILVTAEASGNILAGALFYRTATVMHLQYAASTQQGRDADIFPALYRYVIDNLCHGCSYLDFGTSAAPTTSGFNEGLLQQKHTLGGRPIACDTYTLDL